MSKQKSYSKPIKRLEIRIQIDKKTETHHLSAGPGKQFTEKGIDEVLNKVVTDLDQFKTHDFRMVELAKDKLVFIGTKKPSQYQIDEKPVTKEEFCQAFEVEVKHKKHNHHV